MNKLLLFHPNEFALAEKHIAHIREGKGKNICIESADSFAQTIFFSYTANSKETECSCIRIRCIDSIPYIVIRKIIEAVCALSSIDIAAINEPWLHEILYNELKNQDASTSSIERRTYIINSCREFLLEKITVITEKKPLLFFIENLDKADYSSLCILCSLMKEFEQYKTGFFYFFSQKSSAEHLLLRTMIESHTQEHIFLPELTADSIGVFFEEYLPKTSVHKIFTITKGNPFYISGLMTYLEHLPVKVSTDKIPPSVGDIIRHNLKQLNENQKTLLYYIAFAYTPVSLPHVQQLSSPSLHEDMQILIGQRWIIENNGEFFLASEQLQHILAAILPEDVKKQTHMTIADNIENKTDDDKTSFYDLAYHRHNAGDLEKAVKYYLIAGMQALRKDALHEAIIVFKTLLDVLEFAEYKEKRKVYLYVVEMLIKISLYINPPVCIDACKKYQRLLEDVHDDKGSLKKMFMSPFAALSQNLFKTGSAGKADMNGIFDFEGREEDKLIFSQIQLLQALLLVHKHTEADGVIRDIEQVVKSNYLLKTFVQGLKAQKEIQTGKMIEGREHIEKIIAELGAKKIEKSRFFWWISAYFYWVYLSSFTAYGIKYNDEYLLKAKKICIENRFQELLFLLSLSEAEKLCLDGRYRAFEQSAASMNELLSGMQFPSFLAQKLYHLLVIESYILGEFNLCEYRADQLRASALLYQDPRLEIQSSLYLGLSQFENKKEREAADLLKSLIEKAKNTYYEQVIPCLLAYADMCRNMNNQEAVQQILPQCQPKIDEEYADSVYQMQFCGIAGWLGASAQKFDEADAMFHKGLATALKEGNLLEEGKLHIQEGIYYAIKKEMQNSVVAFETASAKFIMIDNKWWLSQVSEYREKVKKGSPAVQPAHNQQPQTEDEASNTLLEFSKLVTSTLDLKLILQTVIEQSMTLVNAERGFLILLDEEKKNKHEISRIYKDNAFKDGSSADATSSSIIQHVIQTGEIVCLEDAQQHETFKHAESIKNLDIRTVIAVPLKSGNELIGIIYVDRSGITSTFTQEEVKILESLSGYASMALVNAQLHNQIKERAEKLQMLNELSRSISSSTFLHSVIKQVLNYCLTVTKADKGYIFLGSELEFKGGLSISGEELERSDAGKSVSRTIIRKVLLSGKSLVISDITDEKELTSSASIANLQLQSAMCVPMIVNNQVIGVVYVSSNQINKQFNEKNLNILESIVTQASLAVENAQLLENQRKYITDLEKAMKMYQRAQEKANTDPLTGLCNHGYFMDQLNREFIMAKRYNNIFTLIFIDIDLFKDINDTYGHQTGDKVLKDVAFVIQSECRQTDLGARYGGDEMAIILSDTDADRALIIAERLREKINKIEIISEPEKKYVYTSIGVAAIQESDKSTADLLERVDHALYTAKENGRNRVCRWGDAQEVSIEEIREKLKKDKDEVNDLLSILSAVSSLKDQTLLWHSVEMGDLIVELGKEYNLSRAQIEELKMAAVLHDIGKVGIPDDILKKKGPLTDEEWRIMRSHTKFGRDILQKSNNLKKISQAIYYHHERWDGTGYPEGLKGEQIPLTARIISIIDAFEAMITERPYRKALTVSDAIQELEKNAGSQFDPKLVKIFLKKKDLIDKIQGNK